MRISPEPLTPLRNWRELWQTEPPIVDNTVAERRPSQTSMLRKQKQGGFNWLNHLFSRELPK